MKRKSHTTFAAIHLGSEKISMQITEYRNLDKYKVIERVSRRIRLGEATFKNKIIPFELVSEICEILQGFKRLMVEYGNTSCRLPPPCGRPATKSFFWIKFIAKPAWRSRLWICPRKSTPSLWPFAKP